MFQSRRQNEPVCTCQIRAACICHTGKVRGNNEDNYYFFGTYEKLQHNNMGRPMEDRHTTGESAAAAIFYGMGGEHAGELASFAAAQRLSAEALYGIYPSRQEI